MSFALRALRLPCDNTAFRLLGLSKMGRKQRRQGSSQADGLSAAATAAARGRTIRPWLPVPLLAWLLFYAVPLFSPGASIQWDAVDVHYCSQRYLSDEIRAGRLPLWTPFILSGFPFLADPQVGAFYPLNWPFVLAGASPKLIQAEIALHSLLALAGMLLLLRLHVRDEWAAVLGSMAYGLSGFFAGHASHVGMVQAASLLPWLLYCGEQALRGPFLRWLGAAGAVAGLIILAGHFQTALYCCAALAVYTAARAAAERRVWARALALLAGSAVIAFLISGVMTLPGLELTRESIRAGQDYSTSREGVLELRALATLMAPDALGALGPNYHGPGDKTQYYFYAGVVLLPLAAFGLWAKRGAAVPAVLALASIWFMLGPDAGLYRLAAWIPQFRQVRAPVHAWFVAALALAWLAAAGLDGIRLRMPAGWIGWGVCLFMALDLCLVNSWNNPLTYMRRSFEEAYGVGLGILEERVGRALPAGMRFAAPDGLYAFGPLNGPLLARVESTYGYNPLQLKRYAGFRQMAEENPKLLDALGSALLLNPDTGRLVQNQGALPKAWFPSEVRKVEEGNELPALKGLDPARQAIANEDASPAEAAQVLSIDAGQTEWRIRYQTQRAGLLVLSLPWFPGWKAEVNGRELALLRVDHALTGVVVPEGRHELTLRFQSRRLLPGVLLSLFGSLLAAALWIRDRRSAFENRNGQSSTEAANRAG